MTTKLDQAFERGGAEAVYAEIIGFGEAFSRTLQEADRLRDLAKLAHRRCGGCQHWMKSRACPSERNVNGRNQGPSMNGVICSKFAPTKEQLSHEVNYRDAVLARSHPYQQPVNE